VTLLDGFGIQIPMVVVAFKIRSMRMHVQARWAGEAFSPIPALHVETTYTTSNYDYDASAIISSR
jgi:hypothetical protein